MQRSNGGATGAVRMRAPRLEEQIVKMVVEGPSPTHRHRAERVAVVSALDGQQPRARRVAPRALILQAHLDGDLDGHRSRVGEEHPLEPGGRQPGEPLGEP